MDELLKTIRNSHYLLLLACLALILLSYSAYLTRIYQSASDEVIAFEKLKIQRFFEFKNWDIPVGGPNTSLGGMISHSMPKFMQELFSAGFGNAFFDNKQYYLEMEKSSKEVLIKTTEQAGVNFVDGFNFRDTQFLPFSDPRKTIYITDAMTLQEIYDTLTSREARSPFELFVPSDEQLKEKLSEWLPAYKSKKLGIGAVYFDEIKPVLDVQTATMVPAGVLVICSASIVPPQEPRRCSVANTKADTKEERIFALSEVRGESVPIIGSSLEDWIANQEITKQFAFYRGKGDVRLDYFRNLRLIWSEVRFMTIEKAKAYLSDRRATYTQDLPIEGLKASGQSALVLGPILLICLLVHLRSHLWHLRCMKDDVPEFPWIGFYNGLTDKLFTAGSIVLLPFIACILEAIFFTYFTALLWICGISAPLLLYLGILSIRDLKEIRNRREASEKII
ncbi:hypothetical protein [Pseudomonas sp. PD9R]|uniref:hypothetical protein n=1 Tax=Pseudomonas sp. PD9R TaxID=2853534 RepID=UPI001C46D2ED|nr:hypothetical protein [Pseudomonas sp. PD9R]MBV6823558.1 hypothetical protein [Pseudomonas sp. PD9R]